MTTADRLTIRMPASVWSGIDGSMDNRATNAMWEYWNGGGEIGDPADPDVGPDSRFARAIREQGWQQIDDAWQRPPDELLDICLTAAQWEFILATARDDLPIYEELATTADAISRRDMLASAELCRATTEIVAPALGRWRSS